jgi:hypothetical protein
MRRITNPDHVVIPVPDEKWALAGIELSDSQDWDISTPGYARVRYNHTLHRIELSENGSSYFGFNNYSIYRAQTIWYINSSTGDDSNTGLSSGAAIKTFEEFRRRHGGELGSNAPVNVYLDGAGGVFTGDVIVDMLIKESPEGLVISGYRTAIFSGIITDVQNYNQGAAEAPWIEDTSIPVSWTASGLIGKIIHLTTGVHAGYAGWAVEDLTDSMARVTLFADFATGLTDNPVVTDHYNVSNLTQMDGDVYVDTSGGEVRFMNLSFGEVGAHVYNQTSGVARFVFCRIDSCSWEQWGGQSIYFECLLNEHANQARAGESMWYYGGAMSDSILGSIRSHVMMIMAPMILQNSGMSVHTGGSIQMYEDVAFFANDTRASISVGPLGRFMTAAGAIPWGIGNGYNYAITISPEGIFITGNEPVIETAGVSDTIIGTTSKTFAEFNSGFIHATNMARSIPG